MRLGETLLTGVVRGVDRGVDPADNRSAGFDNVSVKMLSFSSGTVLKKVTLKESKINRLYYRRLISRPM